MSEIGLFHLHFYTKYYKEYEEFLVSKLGFKVKGRFSIEGEHLDSVLSWEEIESRNIKLRLIEIQKGAVNIVLMPGKFEEAKLEHFGFLLSKNKFEHVLKQAKELGLQVRENPHRTFISSKLGFRIEIHNIEDSREDSVDKMFNELYIKNLEFSTDRPTEFKALFFNLFGIKAEGEEFLLRDSRIKLSAGKFALKSFKLAGSEYDSLGIENSELIKGLPLKLSGSGKTTIV